MQQYEYRCPECRNTILSPHRADRSVAWCRKCTEYREHRRVFGIYVARGMVEHYNQSIGAYVTSERQFRDELKRGAELETLRTGIEHNYEPVDMSDTKSLGVTAEGLEATNRVRVAEGKKPIDLDKI